MQRRYSGKTATGIVGIISLLGVMLVPGLTSAAGSARPHRQSVRSTFTATVTIPGPKPWTDTGIDVSVGTTVTVKAGGSISFAAGPNNNYTPNGLAGCVATEDMVAPGRTCYSLVVRVGNGSPVELGTGGTWVMKTTGRLGLGVNDNVFSDNTGSWTAAITITN